MPELPEVETTRQGVSHYIKSQKVQKVNIHFPTLRWPIDKKLCDILPGQTLKDIKRRGKYLIFEFQTGTLIIHLGMSGSLRITSVTHQKEKHDHFELIFNRNCILRLRDPRRFGAVLWTETDWKTHELIKNLGPEPLEKTFTALYLHTLSRNKTVSIKNFIMNSHIVVGVGNIYANESLFLAGIHPKTPAKKISLPRYEKLVTAIKQVLRMAIKQGGTTLKDFASPEGKPGYFALQLNVYGRENATCYVCGKPIKHCIIGQRATYYCPNCQH